LSETRNYVQRVIENLAVYRVRFDDSGTAVASKADGRVVRQETNAAPQGSEASAGNR
jgi:soluble lytic murein transglycosylase